MSQADMPPAGWQPDPWGRHQYRFWDGSGWTAQVADGSYQSVDQPPPVMTRPGSGPTDWKGRSAGLPPNGPGSLGDIGRRFLGSLIDGLVLLPAAIVSLFIRHLHFVNERDPSTGITHLHLVARQVPTVVSLLLLAPSALYTIVLIATRGQTLGEMALHLRVVRRGDGGAPGWVVSCKRWSLPGLVGIVRALSAPIGSLLGVVVIVDLLWALWDPNRQCLHDKLAGTLVIATA